MLNATEYEVLAMFADGADPATISDDLGMPLMSVGHILNEKANRKRTVARELINQQKPPALAAAKKAQSPLTAPIVKPAKDRAKEVPERLREPFFAECARKGCDWRSEGHPTDAAARTALGSHVADHDRRDYETREHVTYGNSTQSVDTATIPGSTLVVSRTTPAPQAMSITVSGTPSQVKAGLAEVAAMAGDLDSMDGLHLAALDIPDLRDQAIALGNQAADLRSKVVEHRRQAAVREEIAQLEARLAELRAVVAA